MVSRLGHVDVHTYIDVGMVAPMFDARQQNLRTRSWESVDVVMVGWGVCVWLGGVSEGSVHNTYRRHLAAHLEEIFRGSKSFVLPTHFTFYCISNAFLPVTLPLSLSFEFR